MTGSEQGKKIVDARINRVNSQLSLNTADTRIKEFKAKIQSKEDEALEYISRNNGYAQNKNYLHVAIDNRRNDFVEKVLEELCSREDGGCVDQTDDAGATGAGADSEAIRILKDAVMFATANNDPDTLEQILKWGRENKYSSLNSLPRDPCPLEYACLRNHNHCINILCKYGYELQLDDEDKNILEKMLTDQDSARNDSHFYKKFLLGDRHVAQFYQLPLFNLITKRQRDETDTDPVEGFIRFKAFAAPHYIASHFVEKCKQKPDLAKDEFRLCDPIRTSLCLARYSKLLSFYHVQYSQEYLEISRRCEELATSILDHCEDMDDVNTLLEYSINSQDENQISNNDNDTNWHLALQAHHKTFVSHHYFQNFLWKKMTGEDFNWDNMFLMWKILYYPFTVLLFLLVPFVVVIDAIWRRGDLLFVSPEMKQPLKGTNVKQVEEGRALTVREKGDRTADESEAESSFYQYFRTRIHRPIMRMMFYHFMEVLFLICLILSLVDPMDELKQAEKRTKKLQVYDIITLVFIVSYVFESFLDLCRRKWQSLSSFWQIYNLLNSLCLAVGGLVACIAFYLMDDDNRAELSGNNVVNVGCTIFAIGATLSLLKPLRWFLLSKFLGPVVVCIIKVLQDFSHVFLIYFVITAAFSFSSYSMFKPFTIHDGGYELRQDNIVSFNGLLFAMFWRIYDPGHPEYATVLRNITGCQNKTDDDYYSDHCVSVEFSHIMTRAMWAVYQGIVIVLLMNILIAMMNTTYNHIWSSSDTQWKYSKSFYQIQFLFPREALPSPFRILYYVAKFRYWMRGNRTPQSLANNEQFQKYRARLIEIVKGKVHADFEDSMEDDFSDLRKDLQNIVTEKHEDSSKELSDLRKEIDEMKRMLQSIVDHQKKMK